jgi:acyl phosphate:glycerol-3-phosphate acyltransferase
VAKTLLIFIFVYLAGSVNFAIIFFKLTGKGDPRLSFSGNAGTTNIYRQAGILWASVVFLLDISRAMAVAFMAIYFLKDFLLAWVAFFLVLGNSFPCFHSFRGGKGVANYLGFTVLAAPWAALAAAITWLVVYGVVRVTFIASFFMVFILSCGQVLTFHWQLQAATGALATFILILFNHRKNITSYYNATESQIFNK